MTAEKRRLIEDRDKKKYWRRFGPYLAERQWGTVREDYSADGDAWQYLTHDQARSKAFRWGEEGIGGICDEHQLLNFSLAFWNTKDPILKERLFGLTGKEGNHGEDCKEHYYYLDSTPTHSYMKMLYKYPQEAFPYRQLIDENGKRNRSQPEFDLVDTGIFNEDKYFDIFIEYAKAAPDDLLIKISVHNRGPVKATLHVLPQAWFRNTWSWGYHSYRPDMFKDSKGVIRLHHENLGAFYLYGEGQSDLLFCENETNTQRLYGYPTEGTFKDGINDFVVDQKPGTLNASHHGTKAAFHYKMSLAAGKSKVLRLRLADRFLSAPFEEYDLEFERRREEADEFYGAMQTTVRNPDDKVIQRQAFGGMMWSKQFYYYDVGQWLKGDPAQPPPPAQRLGIRNHEWKHLNNADVISMPDKWEYPWYAAWDLAFHTIPLAMIDPEFAKSQLMLLTKEWYMHPNGQLPAYEWSFSDVNPPVHGWATWRVYQIDRKLNDGVGDRKFLEEVFHKLLLNFTWWINRKDHLGNNIFEGGFLGMDNIGVFDRSRPQPEGGRIEQSDGTSWMAMFTLNMLRISLELAKENSVYQSLATKFFEHFLYIAGAMANVGVDSINLWDDEDEFYYDVLHTRDNRRMKIKLRSMVGLIPLFAVEVLEEEVFRDNPEFNKRLLWFLGNRPDLANLISRWHEKGRGERHLLSLLRGHRMKALLKRMLDPNEFLSEYGIRALSKIYEKEPYAFHHNGIEFTVRYIPGEAETFLFGGNSNWRGPVWFPVNYLIIESLQRFHHYYGSDFKVEHPTGSGNFITLKEIANDLSDRLIKLFRKDAHGRRPAYGGYDKMQTDKHFNDYVWFYEYFHGDNGSGCGASHQTGWTGLVAKLIQQRNKG
ncbi:MAG TPA: glucosidase [Chryseosolibacter sp.]